MGFVAGRVDVTLGPGPTIIETFTPAVGANLARELYEGGAVSPIPNTAPPALLQPGGGRKHAAKLPNPDQPLGGQITADVNPGDVTLAVAHAGMPTWDASLAYENGDLLFSFDYVSTATDGAGHFLSKSVQIFVDGVPPGANAINVKQGDGTVGMPTDLNPAAPTPLIPAYVSQTATPRSFFGFQGTLADWQAQVVPQVFKQLKPIGDMCTADAAVLVAHLQKNTFITRRTSGVFGALAIGASQVVTSNIGTVALVGNPSKIALSGNVSVVPNVDAVAGAWYQHFTLNVEVSFDGGATYPIAIPLPLHDQAGYPFAQSVPFGKRAIFPISIDADNGAASTGTVVVKMTLKVEADSQGVSITSGAYALEAVFT